MQWIVKISYRTKNFPEPNLILGDLSLQIALSNERLSNQVEISKFKKGSA